MLWGSSHVTYGEKFLAKNILSNKKDFSNATFANFWLAKEKTAKGQGFVMKVGNSKRKIVGVHVKNIYYNNERHWATNQFLLEGSLLEENETISQREQASWTPQILKKAGRWEELLEVTLEDRRQSKQPPPLQTFFFKNTTEIRYLWFHLVSFYGKSGGGLQYFAPILQLGEPCAYL